MTNKKKYDDLDPAFRTMAILKEIETERVAKARQAIEAKKAAAEANAAALRLDANRERTGVPFTVIQIGSKNNRFAGRGEGIDGVNDALGRLFDRDKPATGITIQYATVFKPETADLFMVVQASGFDAQIVDGWKFVQIGTDGKAVAA